MAIISLGKISTKIFIPIFGGLIRLFYDVFINKSPKLDNIIKNPFLLSIYTEIGMTFAFIPFLILKIRMKKKVQNENANESTQV